MSNINSVNGQINPVKVFNVNNAIFSLVFSEQHSNMVSVITGDGFFKMFEFSTDNPMPKISVKLSNKELSSVACNHFIPSLYLIGGNDRRISLVDVVTQKVDVISTNDHLSNISQVVWHPRMKSIFASASNDGKINFFDLASKGSKLTSMIVDLKDVLSIDFNKYNDTLVTGSVDNSVKVYDLRHTSVPLYAFTGHKYGVKKVKFSPFSENIIISGSLFTKKRYDSESMGYKQNRRQSSGRLPR
jgi:peroxin-7